MSRALDVTKFRNCFSTGVRMMLESDIGKDLMIKRGL